MTRSRAAWVGRVEPGSARLCVNNRPTLRSHSEELAVGLGSLAGCQGQPRNELYGITTQPIEESTIGETV
jgi:hypothetical protein